jgi:hypothetical protein
MAVFLLTLTMLSSAMRLATQPREPPDGHPVSLQSAKSLVDGPLGQVYEKVALSCSAPLLWFRPTDNPPRILHNGTITVARTNKKLFGITAAHVVDQYHEDRQKGGVKLLLKDETIDDLNIIHSSPKRDLATFDLDEQLIKYLGLEPIAWPPQPPVEGQGLLLAGYPGNSRVYTQPMIEWSPFFAIATARTVTPEQITILVPPDDDQVQNSLPLNCDLGGISGGPIIGIFETKNYVAFHRLSGLITEHPNYDKSDFSIERIAGVPADVITEFGIIR